jgi:hypothetical protein
LTTDDDDDDDGEAAARSSSSRISAIVGRFRFFGSHKGKLKRRGKRCLDENRV